MSFEMTFLGMTSQLKKFKLVINLIIDENLAISESCCTWYLVRNRRRVALGSRGEKVDLMDRSQDSIIALLW